jgi:hypothetical protein
MQKLVSFAVAAGLGLVSAGCFLFPFGGGGGGMDMAKMMADQADVKGVIQLNGAQVGTWATWEASGTKMWWGVTGEKDGNWVVENRMPAQKYTMIWVVDSSGNKLEAWVANWDPEAKELSEALPRKLNDAPEAQPGEKPETTEGNETVNAAGKDWDCKWVAMQVAGKESKSWMCDQVPFMGLVKSSYDGNVSMTLSEVGDGATMGFKWPEKK